MFLQERPDLEQGNACPDTGNDSLPEQPAGGSASHPEKVRKFEERYRAILKKVKEEYIPASEYY